jgi:probable HAF family extracellular repeat protein
MSKHKLMLSAAFAAAFVAGPAMAAGTLYTLPLVANSTETIAFGVNNSGNITGFWLDSSGVEHGFVGPADGTNYTSFDDTADGTGTQARGISKKGVVTGIANVSTGNALDYVPFERATDGTITHVTKNGKVLDYLIHGINTMGVFAGNYENATTLVDYPYTGKNAKYKSKIVIKGISNTGGAGRGIDDAGDIVGWYLDSSAVLHGFYMPFGGNAVTVDDPAGANTIGLEGINNRGKAVGMFTDSSGNRHGFVYDIATKTFKELTISGATAVEVWGINDKGVVAIDNETAGYLYCPKATDCPSGAVRAKTQPATLHPGVHVPKLTP